MNLRPKMIAKVADIKTVKFQPRPADWNLILIHIQRIKGFSDSSLGIYKHTPYLNT